MKCLVTGAAGFLGSHLCETLVAGGHTVIGVDNLSSGKRHNLDSLIGNSNFKFIFGDIVKKNGIEKLFPFDWVFHLAGKADLIPSITNPGEYHEVNVNGTLAMLQLCRLYPCKKFIYAASSTCYGIPEIYPTPENAPLKPEHPYGLTKKVGEDYVLHWSKVYKIPALSLRLFNVYGPRARTTGTYGAMFGVFLAQLANDKPLTVVGDGKQKRDFTHVEDVVRAFVMAAKSTHSGEAINIGSGLPRSVNDIAGLLKPSGIVRIPKRPGEPDVTWANNSKAHRLLHWEPQIDIEEGVIQMKESLEEWRSAPLWTKESIAQETKPWFGALS